MMVKFIWALLDSVTGSPALAVITGAGSSSATA